MATTTQTSNPGADATTQPQSTAIVSPAAPQTTAQKIQDGVTVMTNFAIRRGIPLPAVLDATAGSSLLTIHNTLADSIKPATIQSIEYIDSMSMQPSDGNAKLYKIPIFTKCLLIAGFSLLTLIGISLLPTVNEENLSAGLLASSGTILLANLLFVCSAALLGVMFYLLKTVSDKIKSYSLLPIDVIEINTTILIGLISGFIISELFAFTADPLGSNIELHKMTLALLGGFSSDAIFTVLQGIVNKAKSFLGT